MTRKILKDITLSDGTRLPRGTLVVSASDSAHHDEANYADPDVFDGFRFARMREGDGEDTKHQFVHTSLDYMAFGHGRHAWYALVLTLYFNRLTQPLTALDAFLQRTSSRPCLRILCLTMTWSLGTIREHRLIFILELLPCLHLHI